MLLVTCASSHYLSLLASLFSFDLGYYCSLLVLYQYSFGIHTNMTQAIVAYRTSK
jgi:hypothetical protein